MRLAVCSLTTSAAAISWLESPPAMSAQHLELARRELREPGGGAAGCARWVNSAMSRRVTDGANSDPPSATTRIAATSCSSGASLSRKPLAPARSAS